MNKFVKYSALTGQEGFDKPAGWRSEVRGMLRSVLRRHPYYLDLIDSIDKCVFLVHSNIEETGLYELWLLDEFYRDPIGFVDLIARSILRAVSERFLPHEEWEEDVHAFLTNYQFIRHQLSDLASAISESRVEQEE